MELVDANPDFDWSWFNITNGSLNYEKRYFTALSRQLAAFRIQCHFRKARYNPAYSMCRKILEQEFDELYS